MADREPLKNEPGGNRFSRVSRTASFWVLLVLMTVVLLQVMNGGDETSSRFNYTRYKEQLSAGNIHEVTVANGIRIEGELRSPILEEGVETVHFWVMLPNEITEGQLADLEEQGVIINGEPERLGWGTKLFSVLPWLLFPIFSPVRR